MRGRAVLAGLGVFVGAAGLQAQFPPPSSSLPLPAFPSRTLPGSLPGPTFSPPGFPAYPSSPVRPASASFPTNPVYPVNPGVNAPPWNPGVNTAGSPRPIPPALGPTLPLARPLPVAPPAPVAPNAIPPEVRLPFPEEKVPFDSGLVTLKRISGSWQVWAGQRVLKDLGDNEAAAKDVVRVMRELRPTEWVSIGSPRTVVEYGLVNGKPPLVGGFPSAVVPIDLTTVRAEQLRGAWCLRDDNNILFNFGLSQQDAVQAAAVVRKYGFNRVGSVGQPYPAMSYLFAAVDAEQSGRMPNVSVPVALQEAFLTRTGIPVPGVGFVGEMIRIDPRKVELRKLNSEWVVAHGSDVLARVGPTEWIAREALRVVQDGRFTEFCRFGSAGLTFFLVDGKAPTRIPFSAHGRQYDLGALKVQATGTRWRVTETGRPLFDVASPEEGEALIRLLRAYHFDQLCHVGPSPRAGMTFLGRSR